jgi:hypothetical protein
MGCLLILFGLLGPRIGTVLLWLFTDRMSEAYDNGVVPVVGFFVAPWTTFLYAIAQGGGNGVGAFGSFLIFVGVVLDLLSILGARREQSRRS